MNFTLNRAALCLSMITLFLFGCSKSENVTPATPITFLATGARFDYYYEDFLYADSLQTIVGDQIGKDTFLVRNYSPGIPVIPTQYWVIKDNSFYSSFRLRDPNSYGIECKFNKPVGTSWTVKKGSTTYTYTIDAVNSSVVTGKGTVKDAVKIKITSL